MIACDSVSAPVLSSRIAAAVSATRPGERGASGAITSSAVAICGKRGGVERLRPDAIASGDVVLRERLSRVPPRRDEPARGPEDRVALVVRTDRLRRPVRHLRVGARMAQVAHGPQMEHGRVPLLPNPVRQLARDRERHRRVASLHGLVAESRPRPERGLDPPGRGRHADPEAVVLAHEEERERQSLEGALSGRVESRLRARVVQRRVAEGAQDDRVVSPGTRDPEPRSAVDRERHPDRPREMRRDRRGHREHRQLVPAEHLVPPAGDRLGGCRDDPQQDVAQPVDAPLRGAREVEGARAVVEESRVVDAERECDGGVRLVPGRADGVEAAPVLLEPAGRIVGLAALHLRPPEHLGLLRYRDRRGRRRERLESPEEMLLEGIEFVDHGSRRPVYAVIGCSSSADHSPAAASAFMRARWTKTVCAASAFAASPPHAASAEAWSARP